MTNMTSETNPQAARNLRLGLIIGGLCLAQVVVFIIIFSRNGLPKDPNLVVSVVEVSIASGRAAADRLLRAHTRVDAIFAKEDFCQLCWQRAGG